VKALEINGLELDLMEGVYPPAEDTFLMIDALGAMDACGRVLELCCGSGAIGLTIAERLDYLVAIDINPRAVQNTRHNFLKNRLGEKLDPLVGDLFKPLGGALFDLIFINPPYLADVEGIPKDPSWSGGLRGREVIDRFLGSAIRFLSRGGRAVLLQSDLNGIDESFRKAEAAGLTAKVVRSRNFRFESLIAIELEHASRPQKD